MFKWDDTIDTPLAFDIADNFTGGQGSFLKPKSLQPNQASLLQDCEIAITGQVSTRFGTTQLGGLVGGTQATGSINDTLGAPADGDTVTISGPVGGSRTYTFKTTLTPTIGQVHINGQDGSMTNLQSCINGTGTPGTDYASGTAINADVYAGNVASHAIPITAKIGGTAGNAITLAKSSTNVAVSGATLTGGLDNATLIRATTFYNVVANGTTYEVALASAGSFKYVFKFNGTQWVLLEAYPPTDLSGGLDANGTIIQGNQNLYTCNGSDIQSYTGSGTFTNISGDGATAAPRNASYLLWHMNRLVAAGPNIKDTSGGVVWPDVMFFSNILDATTWGTAKDTNSLRIGAGDGLAITAMVPWNKFDIAVFKRHSSWVVTADPTLAVADMPIQQVHPTVGCVAFRTACQVGGDILFLSDDGVRSLKQVIGSVSNPELQTPVSYPVQDIINRINWGSVQSAAAIFWRNLYIIALPLDGSPTNNFLLVYNTLTKTWQGIWTGLPVNCMATREVSGVTHMMAGLSTSSRMIEWNDYVAPANWVTATFQDYQGNNVQPVIQTRAMLQSFKQEGMPYYVQQDPLGTKLAMGGEIEWNNSSGNFVINPILDEIGLFATVTIPLSSGGLVPPIIPPITLPFSGIARQRFDLMSYGEFRQFQFNIAGTGAGRKELRSISLSGWIRSSDVGNS